jgi:hypothetical protein
VRFEPKSFSQRRPDGTGGWIWNLNGVERVLYRLPELLAADPAETIWLPEGEKDVEALVAAGLVATTNPMGAGKWRSNYARFFRGRSVVLLPDKDDPGRDHMLKVAQSLVGIASAIKLFDLPGLLPKGDVSDWLAAGHTVPELLEEIEKAPSWRPVSELPGVLISDVQPEQVQWLWSGHVALGKLTVLTGDPGLGKSTLMLDISARLSTGDAMPDDTPCAAGGVVVLTAEDGLADTVRPRLEAAGANLDQIIAIPHIKTADGERAVVLPDDIGYVETAINRVNAKLVIIDPLTAYLNGRVNIWSDQQVRLALAPLSQMAERSGAAVVVIAHLNKAEDRKNALYRCGGSIALPAAARSVLLVAAEPEVPEHRVLACLKQNLATKGPSLVFRLVAEKDVARILWLGKSDRTADQLLSSEAMHRRRPPTLQKATDFLLQLLAGGPVESSNVERAAEAKGIAQRTLGRAKQELGVVAHRLGFGTEGKWLCALPSDNIDCQVLQPAHMSDLATYDETSKGVRFE